MYCSLNQQMSSKFSLWGYVKRCLSSNKKIKITIQGECREVFFYFELPFHFLIRVQYT